MDEETKERVSTLEVVLGEFIVQTNKALKRMEEDTKILKKEMNKRWGDLANRLGTLAEDIAAPNLRTVAREYFQCEETDSFSVRTERRSVKNRSLITEFDVVLSCQQLFFVNEVKSTSKIEYVDMFIEKLDRIFDYFPEHQGKTVIPIFASLALPENIINYLTKHQIYAMAMSGETMKLLNYEAIKKKD